MATSKTRRARELQAEIESDGGTPLGGMIGASAGMRRIFGLIRKIAPLDVPVVIQGETGTGKELAARALHALSPRAQGPFVVVDCSAIPANLIESELFGHEKGAFTGASQARAGAFERARGGTIFLDELGELRLDLQPKLLRVLESHEVNRVGSNEPLTTDARVVAATNRDLVRDVERGSFRKDLYFRLSVIAFQLPPLRERTEDLPELIAHVLGAPESLRRNGEKRLSGPALAILTRYAWPGNVRELLNVLHQAVALTEGAEIDDSHFPPRLLAEGAPPSVPFDAKLSFKAAKDRVVAAFERDYVASALARAGGNATRAARETGLHRKSIERLVRKHGLAEPTGRPPKR